MTDTGKLKITAFQAFIASGSDISNPDAALAGSGYQHELALELRRIGPGGGTITVDAEGADDLASFAYDLANAVAQEPNPSGARSLIKLHERASELARGLR
jgi:hypothetical protein